jgi:hypothetical protein
VPKPEQGRIVLVKVPDPQSRNAKTRPAVIVSWTEEIAVDGIIACVAITSAVPDKVPDDCILLPFSPGGKSRTGLKMRSAAMCSWLFQNHRRRHNEIHRHGAAPKTPRDSCLP